MNSRAWLRPDVVKVDPIVQRGFRPAHAAKIAREYDPKLFGLAHVSLRVDGSYYVLDGQHRVAAAIKAGYGHVPVEFCVHTGLDTAGEAALFRKLNKLRLGVDPLSTFRLRIVARDPIACEIVRIMAAFGLAPAAQSTATIGMVNAVSCLEDIYLGRFAGKAPSPQPLPELLSRTLHTLTLAWGKQRDAFEKTLLLGVAATLHKHNGRCSAERLGQRLSKHGTPAMVIGQIKSYKSIGKVSHSQAAVRVLEEIYNHKVPGSNRLG